MVDTRGSPGWASPYILMISSVALGGSIAACVLYTRRPTYAYDTSGKKIPGPPCFGFVGFFSQMIKWRSEGVFFKKRHEICQEIGPIVGVSIIGRLLIFLSSPEYARRILAAPIDDFPKDRTYKKLNFMKGGLVVVEGDRWRRDRKLLNPCFEPESMYIMVQSFSRHTTELIDCLTRGRQEAEFDMAEIFSALAFDIICSNGFGYECQTKRKEETDFTKAIRVIMNEMRLRFQVDLFPWSYLLPHRYFKARQAKRIIQEVVDVMISKGRQAPDAVPTTLLDLMVSANSADNVWSNSDFFGQCFTFFLAGHETTSSLMQWTIFELARHPEILERLRAEVDQVLSDCEGVPYECIAKMPYLNAVLKESLRMHPPVTMVIRQAKEDFELGEYTIPKGSALGVNIYTLHHSPDAWELPEVFNPQRWESNTGVDAFQFCPFSAGPRNCIGQRFAMMEASVAIALWVKKLDFKLTDPSKKLECSEFLIVRPKDVRICVSLRKTVQP